MIFIKILCIVVSVVLLIDVIRLFYRVKGGNSGTMTTMLCRPLFGILYNKNMKMWIGLLIWFIEVSVCTSLFWLIVI